MRCGSFRNRNGIVQRYRCLRCGKTCSETQPLDGLRVDFNQACQVVNLLCESDGERGEFFTYLSVERNSKLIINWLTGKRNGGNTVAFLEDLRARVPGHFNLTSDCFNGYTGKLGGGAVRDVFGDSINYATELKVYGKAKATGNQYYNPMVVVDIKRQRRIGESDLTMSTTCHAERTNLSVRTFTRRFTRCTIGYSKKLANLRHAVAMFVCHFNFCRKHSAHGKTPAMAAGLTDHKWEIAELLA